MSDPTPTILARHAGITALWFNGRILEAWYDETGEDANMWLAHASTSEQGPSSQAPRQDEGLWGPVPD